MSSLANPMNPIPLVFGEAELRADGTLLIEGVVTHLPPKELCVLRVLLASPGRVVGKDALIEQAWLGGVIGDESLSRCIYSLRRRLGRHKHYVATVYGRGYRITCTVVGGAVGRVRAQRQLWERLLRVRAFWVGRGTANARWLIRTSRCVWPQRRREFDQVSARPAG